MAEPCSGPKGFSAERQQLLRLLLRDKGIEAAAGQEPIPRRRDPGAPARLSFAQQRLWIIDRLAPGSAAYNIPVAFRLTGRLDVPALLGAMAEVARRHEALRTTFAERDGTPFQIVHPPPVGEQKRAGAVADLSALSAEERDLELLRLAGEAAARPFDLERGPLVRLTLLRLGGDEHALLLTMHHIVSDGWSAGVFMREMTTLYQAFAAGRPSSLPELAIQYPDFAEWQRSRLTGETLAGQLDFWREQLAGAPTALDLPTDRPRSAKPGGRADRGGVRRFAVDQKVTGALSSLCRREGTTLFMALLATFGAVLGRHAGQRDLVVGSPIANRNRAEIEGLIGFFVNSLPLRVDLTGDPAFGELLARVRDRANGAYAHQDLPFERLVEELHLERELGRNPVFQVMLALQNVPPPGAADLPGLTLEPLTAESGAVQLDLTVDVYEQPSGLAGRIGYALELFDAPTVDRLAVHFANLLAAAAAEPGRRISELPLLSTPERHQLVGEWNDSQAAPSVAVPVHRQIEAWPPDAVAVAFHDRQLTYGELVRRAKRLAAHLRSLGVGPEVRVGICAERSPEAVVAVFAVLEAGGVYVPLDPRYPPDRLAYLLADSRAAVLLSDEATLRRLPELAVPVVDLGATYPLGSPPLPERPHPETAAYLLYTSGSTGRPKGVVSTHRGLANWAVAWTARYTRRTPTRCHLQTAGFSFDVFTADVMNALCCAGARLVICPDETVLSPPETFELIAREGVDFLDMVPPLFKGVVEHAAAIGASLGLLRLVIVGADAWPAADRDHAARVCGPATRLVNHYGVTESTVDSCSFEASGGSTAAAPLVPIGRPLANTRLHLLDASLQPVPVGVVGELCIAGRSLGRGYLGRPGLTAERWVPDPFSEEMGGRLYRTGDRARRLADGTLEFLGRLDHQIKLRGVRIEPGEIEAALRAHPGIRDAAVVVPEEGGPKRLVAWVVAAGDELDLAALRGFLRGTLPDTLIPAAFLPLDALPLTPNGKVDRGGLSRRPVERAAGDGLAGHAAPRGPVEEMLAGIWSELLGVQAVGAHDDFFTLGGYSLLVAQVMSRVRQVFGVDLPLRALFEAPTVAAFAAHIEAARREARGLVTPPIVPVPRPGIPEESGLPLSFAQERLWLFDRMQPGLPVYNVPDVRRWRGPLRVETLARALDAIVERHEALRTRIGMSAAGPVQVIEPRLEVPVPVVDLEALPAARREAEAVRQAEAETWRPFDLARGPVLRACALRLAPGDHVLVLTRHHIAFDGWSMDIFSRELAVFYEAFAQGRRPVLPPLPVQYADFAVWQRRWLTGTVLEEQLAWWRERLAGAPALLRLPADRPRPAVQDFRGAIIALPVPGARVEALEELCRREGVTVFMALLGAWEALLSRYGAGTDVVVGSPAANRHRLEIEGLIGFFANVLVLRTDLAGDPTVRELLGRVRETALGAYERQDTPFEKLVEELRPERSLSHTPLFQVMFAFNEMRDGVAGEDGTLASTRLGGLKAAMSRYDLELYAFRGPAFLELAVEYRTDLFDATRISRMLEHLSALLAAMAADPGLPLSDLSFLSEAERHQLLLEWGGGAGPVAEEGTLVDRFVAQAARTPGAMALICGEERRTYGDLLRDAGRLAAHLRSLGVAPEVRAGVCLERTPRLVEALLAVLMAGGAYVPLEPAYPAERLAFMIEDAGLAVLVTEEHLVGRISVEDVRVVLLSGAGEDSRVAARISEPPPPPLPGNLAYVLYTSGSTGRPKAVAVEHRSAAALIAWAGEVLTPAELDGVLAATSVAFDLSVFELFVPLSYGGRVVLAPDALHLPSLPAAGEVTLINTVPSVLAELLRLDGLPPSVRVVNLAGEPLPAGLAAEAHALPSVERVLNLYGPSEDTTYSTWSEVSRESGGAAPAIGRPVAGTRVYLLDAALRPVPAGVDGELCLAGSGLARGYLGRPEPTAERFVPDPFGVPGGRLYRTGDLGRYRPDGEIEFLGRLDHQVKVRGFRIELGEVEAALRRHPAVREVAVVVHQDESGDRRLVACWVPREDGGEAAPSPPDLRSFLAERLPEAMLPSAFLLLPALPLTPNGKVDRQALSRLDPSPHGERSGEGEETALSAGEELVADIWSEVLGLPRVGLEESFFTLGGHSLLATRVTSRLRDVFGVDLPVRALFEAPTVRKLARVVEAARGQGFVPPPLRRMPRPDHLPLSFAQERLWFLDRLAPDGSVYNMPLALRAIAATGQGVEPALLDAVLSEVVRRHEALRTTFDAAAGRPVQVIAPPAPVRLPLIDLSGLPGALSRAEVERLAGEEARRPFDLRRGPLLRGALLALGSGERVVLLTQHHIVSDGWSLGVLVGEISALYRAALAGEPSLPAVLPELPIQYADFALWQREWLGEDGIERQLAFWRERLAGAPATLDLPFDRPRPAVQSFRGAQLGFTLGPGPARDLRRLGRRHGATLFMTLLGGVAVLLQRLSRQDDLVIGTPIANRNHLATEPLIGVFVNSLALRQDLADDPAVCTLLERERETALAAYANQDLPFERLVEELRPERRLSHQPVFQVMFALQNAPAGAIDLPGLILEPLATGAVTAKLDLELHLHEAADAEGEVLQGTLAYAADLFDATTARRLVRQLETVLAGLAAAVDAPGRRISSLPLLAAPERHQVALEWNDTARERLPAVTLHGLVEAQAGLRPDAVALLDDGEALTYGELIRRAGRLAGVLAGAGVGPETRVGICLPNVFERTVALLAVLRAGGAWVPLDPTYPAERLALLAVDAGIRALLTVRELAGRVGGVPAAVLLDSPLPVPAAPFAPPPIQPGDEDHLAYIIYTSGSTGRPNGVMITHRAAVSFVVHASELAGPGPGSRLPHLSSFGFDASVLEIFLTLANGGALIRVPEDERLEPGRLAERLTRHQATAAAITPAMLALLPEPRLRGLETLYVGGDVCPPDLPRRWGTGRRFYNCYGPTETTVFALAGLWDGRSGAPPIGRPIGGTRAYVVDRDLRQVPIGVPGELVIGGPGLARGYLDRPALTAERFVPDPFREEPGGRLYRTGDRARQLPDGRFDFLGRLDSQVKLRGIRIEPGEVETVLARHPAIREAVVIAREEAGGQRLVAYVVLREEEPDLPGLRHFLAHRLPEAMVPSAFVPLDALPLTPNGKVDRAALAGTAPPGEARAIQGRTEPEGPAERLVADLFREVLRLGTFGLEESFFELGGTSLQAAVLVNLLEQRLGAPVPVVTLFQAPSVAGLARLLEGDHLLEAARRPSVLVPLHPGHPGDGPPLFLVHPVGGNVLCYGELARLAGRSPVFGLQAAGLDEGVEPHRSVEEMAACYVDAVRRAAPGGPFRLAGWSFGGLVAFEMARRLAAAGEAVEKLVLLDTPAPGAFHLPEPDEADLLAGLAFDLGGLAGADLGIEPSELRGISAELWRVYRANVEAARAYRPQPYDGRLAVLAAGDNPLLGRLGPALGWQHLAGGVTAEALPAGHYGLLRPPVVHRIAQEL